MPTKAPHKCNHNGCFELTTTKYCPAHAELYRKKFNSWRRMESNKEFYNSSAWKRIRKYILDKEPMCRMCKDVGADMVDHIVPINQGGSKLDPVNLQPLCNSCHAVKRQKEQQEFKKNIVIYKGSKMF